MAERVIEANGVELCTETLGDPAQPAILLIIAVAPRSASSARPAGEHTSCTTSRRAWTSSPERSARHSEAQATSSARRMRSRPRRARDIACFVATNAPRAWPLLRCDALD